MEFVLFLCAALSALTGAITGSRAPGIEVRIQRMSARASIVAPVAARAVAAVVQAQRTPAVSQLLAAISRRVFAFNSGITARGERRRE